MGLLPTGNYARRPHLRGMRALVCVLAAVLSHSSFCWTAADPAAQSETPATLEDIAIHDGPRTLQIEINLSRAVQPRTQVVENPDRLVLDFDNVRPIARQQRIPVNVGTVRGVRVGLFHAEPLVTRVVIDFTGSQEYRLLGIGNSLIISIPKAAAAAASAPPPIVPGPPGPAPATIIPRPAVPSVAAPSTSEPQVWFRSGQLRIVSRGSTFAQVLRAVGAATGASVDFPPELSNERTVADLGPGAPDTVLEQLLHGSGYNYLILGAESGPQRIERISLTRLAEGAMAPPAMPPPARPAPDPAANSSAKTFTLTVNPGGTGTGSLVLYPPGTTCGSSCAAAYPAGTSVTITASPGPGSVFGGWSQCEPISDRTCTVTVNQDVTVMAVFTVEPPH